VSLRERTDKVRTHTRRVLNRRKPSAAKIDDAGDEDGVDEPETIGAVARVSAAPPPDKPAPGARPVRSTTGRTGRPSGKRDSRRR
jgi:preprotein translocase subunit SecF